MKTSCIAAIFLLIFTACRREIESEDISVINLHPSDIKIQSFFSLVDTVFIIPLETSEESLIGNISGIRISEEKIVIVNTLPTNSEVLVFDRSGNYQFKLSKMGVGPGEYLSINSADGKPNSNNLMMVDGSTRRLIEYSPESEVISSFKVGSVITSLQTIQTSAGLQFIISSGERLSEPDYSYSLFRLNEEGELIEKMLPFEYTSRMTTGSTQRLFKVSEKLVSFNREFSNYIYYITETDLFKRYYLDFPKPILPAEKSNINFLKNGNPQVSNYVFNIVVQESEEYVSCRYLLDWKLYWFFYHKPSMQAIQISPPVINDCKDCGYLISSELLSTEFLVFPIKSTELISAIEEFKNNGLEYLSVPSFPSGWNTSSNPVLFMVKLKKYNENI